MNKIPGLNSNVFFDPVGLPFSQVSSEVPFPPNALAYYKLDEASGAVIDAVNGYNGTNNEATPNVAGKINTAYEFDGLLDSISMGDVLGFERTDSFSYSFWMYLDESSIPLSFFMMLIDKSKASTSFQGIELYLSQSTGKLTLGLISDNATTNKLEVESDTAVDLQTWQNIAVTYDGSSNASGVKMYYNGVAVATSTITDALTSTIINTEPFGIGAALARSALYFKGTIDELAIFNRALSSTEISNLYNDGAGRQI